MVPNNRMIAVAAVAAFVLSGFVTTRYTQAQKSKKLAKSSPVASTRQTAVPPSEHQHLPYTGHMRFKSQVVQSQPDLITVELDLDLWQGRQLGFNIPGRDGVRIDVGVYGPEDRECRGDRVASFTGDRREIGPMDVPIAEHASVKVVVPPSRLPYNVVVQLIGGLVKNGPVGIMSKRDASRLTGPVPIVFSAERVPARLGF